MLGKGWSGVNESKRMTAEGISKAHLLTTAEVVSRCALAWGRTNGYLSADDVFHGRKSNAVHFLLLAQRNKADGKIKGQATGRRVQGQCLQRRIVFQNVVQQVGKIALAMPLR